MKTKLVVNESNAERCYIWALHRGGVAEWVSQDLSSRKPNMLTPVLTDDAPTPAPDKTYTTVPVVYTAEDIEVEVSGIFDTVDITLQVRGIGAYLTRSSRRALERAEAKCRKKHGDAFSIRSGDLVKPEMQVRYIRSKTPLKEYMDNLNKQAQEVLAHTQ